MDGHDELSTEEEVRVVGDFSFLDGTRHDLEKKPEFGIDFVEIRNLAMNVVDLK